MKAILCDLLVSVWNSAIRHTWTVIQSGQDQYPSSLHCSNVHLCMSEVKTFQMVYVHNWKMVVMRPNPGKQLTLNAKSNCERRWMMGVKGGCSYIFIQVGLLQVYHFKLDSLQNLLQRLTCFVVQLFTLRHTNTHWVSLLLSCYWDNKIVNAVKHNILFKSRIMVLDLSLWKEESSSCFLFPVIPQNTQVLAYTTTNVLLCIAAVFFLTFLSQKDFW